MISLYVGVLVEAIPVVEVLVEVIICDSASELEVKIHSVVNN